MAIDGLIILDPVAGRPIIQTNFRSKGPSYPLLHIDAFNAARAINTAIDPVLYVTTPTGPSACCHVNAGSLSFLCPVSTDVDPLLVFAFLQTFTETLKEYLGEISIATLKDHFDVIHQLLEEMLDEGQPLTTELNTLKDIVIPPSFFNKVLSAAGAAGLAKAATSTPFSSPIPWRKTGLRYNHNEILFDMSEQLDAIVNKQGTIISSQVWGSIKSTARLSGTPDLLLNFTNAQILSDCSFHPSVRLQRWTRDKSISFVPPDGNFSLMDYRYVPMSATGTPQPVPMAVSLKPLVTLHENGGTIELALTSRISSKIMDNVVVEIGLGDGASGANCHASTASSWTYDPRTKSLRWQIASCPPMSVHTLKGTFTSTALHPRPARAFTISYHVSQYSYSTLKIDQLKMTGEAYKLAKGFRPSATGQIEVRW